MDSNLKADLSFWMTLDGTIIEATQCFLEVLGYTRDEVVGKGVALILGSGWRQSRECEECWILLRKGSFKFVKVKLLGKTQPQDLWVRCCFTAIRDGEVVTAVAACCADDTAEMMRNLDSSSQIDSIRRSQAVISFSMDGTVLEANQIFLDLMGYTLEEIVGEHHNMFVEDPNCSEYADFWERLKQGICQSAEFKRIGKGGKQVWMQASYTPILDLNGKPWKVVKYATDISVQKQVEQSALKSTETALEKEKRTLEGILSSSVDPILVIDTNGIIQRVNASTLRMFGYDEEELVGRNVTLLMPQPFKDQHDSYLLRYTSTGVKRVIGTGRDVLGQRKDGSTLPLHLAVSEVKTDSGRFFAGFLTDLSELKKAQTALEKEKRTLEGILLSSVDPILVINTTGIILRVNASTSRMFGYLESELLGHNVTMLMPQPYRDQHDEYLQRYLSSGIKRVIGIGREVVGLRKDGSTLPLHLAVSEVVIDGAYCFAGFLTDLSELKRAFLLADKAKSMFLANMSHEIRTPMNGIFGMLTLLRDSLIDDTSRAYLDTCMRSAESLLAILNDILLFSKAEANAIELEHIPFNLNQIIEDVLQVAATNVSSPQDLDLAYFVKTDVPLCLIGDPSRLRQILMNIVSNGVKFTRFGDVSVDVSVHSRSPLTLTFEVSDTGIGISHADQEKLFMPFSQADESTTRKFGGTGLGLAVCKHLVTLFHGEIFVQSRLGRGSTFTFTAQFELDSSRGSIQSLSRSLDISADEASILEKLKILIIDDNATNCVAVEETLKYFKCNAMAARSGTDGIDLLRAASLKGNPFDLVLLDHHMPHMSGVEVAKAIERLGLHPMLVGLSTDLDKALTSESRFHGYFAKPIRRAPLLRMICSLFSGSKASTTRSRFPMESPRTSSTVANAAISVLVVEDHEVNRQMLSSILRQKDYQVIEAMNGADALERLADHHVDVVLMDVHMPVLDGISTMKIMKEKGYTVPVVVITADVTNENTNRCEEVGTVKLLLKPINMKQLLEVLNDVLAGSSSNTKKVRWLIADDVETNRLLAAHAVRKVCGQDTDVVFATNGMEAVQLAGESMFDFILMDLKMPRMDGAEAARKIRELGIPMKIIGLTGMDDSDTQRECREAGMDRILVKPLRAKELALAIGSSVVGRKAEFKAFEPPLFDESFTEDLDSKAKRAILLGWKTSSLDALKVVRQLFASKEWEGVERVAHALQGASGQVGATRASSIARAIEHEAKTRAPQSEDRMGSLIDELASTMEQTFQRLSV